MYVKIVVCLYVYLSLPLSINLYLYIRAYVYAALETVYLDFAVGSHSHVITYT